MMKSPLQMLALVECCNEVIELLASPSRALEAHYVKLQFGS